MQAVSDMVNLNTQIVFKKPLTYPSEYLCNVFMQRIYARSQSYRLKIVATSLLPCPTVEHQNPGSMRVPHYTVLPVQDAALPC